MRLINAIKYDILFQFRHGFYYAYLFISLVYIGILNFIPDAVNTKASVIIILTDPSVLGAFFIGAIFILEKTQNTIEGLFTTPIKVSEYILGKILSLTMLSTLSCILIVLMGSHEQINFFLFLIGVILTSILFSLIGFILALYAKTVNQYFLYSMLTIILSLPIFGYLNLFQTNVFYIFPLQATLLLIDGAYHSLSFLKFSYAFIYLSLWCVISYLFLEYLLKRMVKKA